MDILMRIILALILASLSFSCARLLPAEPRAAEPSPLNDGNGGNGGNNGGNNQNSFEGQFLKADGAAVNFKMFADKPTIIFFAGEFCAACREETEQLVELFKNKGQPTMINLATVLVGSTHEEITGWIETFEQGQPTWTVGADSEDLLFYKKYFSKLVTPSILYVNPSTNEIKKFQTKISIDDLQKETTPWY